MKKDYIGEIKEIYELQHKISLAFQNLLTAFGACDISPREFLILENIGDREVFVREIERSQANLTYNLRKLIRCGYVEELDEKLDKRRTYVKATEKGAELIRTIREAANAEQKGKIKNSK